MSNTFSKLKSFFYDFLFNMNVDYDVTELWETEYQEELNQLLNEIENEENKKFNSRTYVECDDDDDEIIIIKRKFKNF